MDGEMPDYLLAKDLILQVSLTKSKGICFRSLFMTYWKFKIYQFDRAYDFQLFDL